MTFANGSETYVSQPNRSTYSSIPRGRLDYPCYAEYLTDDVNADNGPWPEVAFVTFAMGSETCVSQLVMSTARLRAVKPSSRANILASQAGKSAPGYNQFGSQISRL